MNDIPSKPLVHELSSSASKTLTRKSLVVLLTIVFAGGLTGYLLSRAVSRNAIIGGSSGGSVSGGKVVVGSSNAKNFKDSAEGTLEAGGVDGEGTHHLVRPGGPSQNVYLTSSVLDLNQFVGKKVKVWGETFAAQQAGWFMDVGKLEVEN